MKVLEKGRVSALFNGAEGNTWVGRPCYFSVGREHLPLLVNGRRMLLEFKLPKHILDPEAEPKAFKLGINERFLPRRDYREINLYRLTDNNYLEMTVSDTNLFDLKEDSALFIKSLRAAICKYASDNPSTKQFLFRAEGEYSKFIVNTLVEYNDELSEAYRITPIKELNGPYYGFDLDILSLTA
ncbi:hypothetical protein [Vibrio penaeicida]|uniref:hypothetical protein n=1 Tax=Vibrio penaeicida TaxID=104609 RepID=UPI000CEA6803|nr:hypothetical protein [Vibrio penaeicida]